MENEKKKGFFARFQKEKPDAVAEDTTPTLGYFFKLLWRKLGKLTSLNLIMLVQYLPLIAAVLIYFFGDTTPTSENALFAPLLGVQMHGTSPTANLLLGLIGKQLNVPYLTTGRMIAIIALVLFTVVTWGWQNVGATYNLRSMVRGDSCFLFSDYFYAVRRNLRQGLLFGILDFAVIAVLLFDIYYFSTLAGTLIFGVMYIFLIALFIIYTMMRFYIYHMMITFDLSIRKLLKNALIFSILGIKRNIVGLIGIAAVLGINIAIILPSLSVGFAIPLILPFFYFPALAGFIAAYAAWPNIQRYMIDPYTAMIGDESGDTEDAATPPAVD